MLIISLEQLHFHAAIGFYEEERTLGNDFLIDVHIKVSEQKKDITELSETIDYEQVYEIIKKEMTKELPLIESVAQNCIHAIEARWSKMKGIKIIIKKLHPPLSGEVGASKITFSKNFS